MNLGQNVCLDHFFVRFSKCYDSQVSYSGPYLGALFNFLDKGMIVKQDLT